MNRQATCPVYVSEPPHHFHTHLCPNTARHKIQDEDGAKATVCGTHYNAWRRMKLYLSIDAFIGRKR